MIHHADDPDSGEPRRRRRRPRSRPPEAVTEEAARGVLLDGARIAEEFGRTPGWFLFLTHRTVELWAQARPQDRGELFTPRSHAERLAELTLLAIDPGMEGPLSVLTDLLREPVRADEGRVVEACRAVSAWAAGQGKLETALLFAEAATLVRPGSARLLYEAGKVARQAARWPAAEKWLGAAVEVGRKTKDWNSYCRALGSMGVMFQKRGNLRVARSYLLRAAKSARQSEEPTVLGEVAHHLFVVLTESGDREQAGRWARIAMDAYGPEGEKLPILAHDIAFSWLERGEFAQALQVFQAILPHITSPEARVSVLASMARAAGACGARSEFSDSSAGFQTVIRSAGGFENGAAALLDVARGAAGLRQWDLASACVREAIAEAERRGQGKVRLEAEALAESISAEQRSAERSRSEGEAGNEARNLAADLLALLALRP